MRVGIVSAALFGVALTIAPQALADPDAGHPWDASWAGGFEDGGDGVQLIVAGNEVIGFFYHGDYLDVTRSEPLAADGSLSFAWARGKATLREEGGQRTITIHEDGATTDKVVKLLPG